MMTGISLLFYPVVSLVHYVRHIALATVSSSRHDIILAWRSLWCSYYCFFYYCFSYCFVVIALRRPSGCGVSVCRLHGFKIWVEDCGSKRRTVVYIKPFLSLLAIIISSMAQNTTNLPTANEPSLSVNTRCQSLSLSLSLLL
jgi:hypothetical protein